MDRSTLIFIFIIIIILIVYKIIRDSLFSNRECNKKYTDKPGFMECPSKCKNTMPSKECNDDKCKISYSCVNNNIYKKLYNNSILNN